MLENSKVRLLVAAIALAAVALLTRAPAHAPAGSGAIGAPATGRPVAVGVAGTRSGTAGGPSTDRAATVAHPEVGFHSRQHLIEHWHKHGAEFGATSPEAYLRLAQALRDASAGGPVLEARRGDGVITRFDRGSGAFLAFDDDLRIRTFFKPNDGERYFQRQLEREHSR